MQTPDGLGRAAWQRHVNGVLAQPRFQLTRTQLARARVDEGFKRLARLVGGAAHGAPFRGRQLRDAA